MLPIKSEISQVEKSRDVIPEGQLRPRRQAAVKAKQLMKTMR